MALIASFGLFVLSIVVAALSRILAADIEAWSPSIVRGLVKLAIGRLPKGYRDRYEEEWQSHVNEVPGTFAKLIMAAGLLPAAYRIAMSRWGSNEIERWLQKVAQLEELQHRIIGTAAALQDDASLYSDESTKSQARDIIGRASGQLDLLSRERTAISGLSGLLSSWPQALAMKVLFRKQVRDIREGLEEALHATGQTAELADRLQKVLDARRRILHALMGPPDAET
jgi:hypothetical protein